jgi:hypothetical protein
MTPLNIIGAPIQVSDIVDRTVGVKIIGLKLSDMSYFST